MRYRLFVHMAVSDDLDGRAVLRRRCNMRLRDLFAMGNVSRVKGIVGDRNRGWLRTPLGGNGGQQYYLWWTKTGLPAFRGERANGQYRDAIWVRSVRHHDDHSVLDFGDIENDYFPFNYKELIDDDLFTLPPWTDEQLDCIHSDADIRVIYGNPGSGKTTSLLKIIEDAGGDKVLFSSWSRGLTQVARSYIDAMPSQRKNVLAYDFQGLLSLICQRDIDRLSFVESRGRFLDGLASLHLRPDLLGEWLHNQDALYAEARSVLFGRAIPERPDSVMLPSGIHSLTEERYLSSRGTESGIGYDAARTVLNVINHLDKKVDLVNIFPELEAAGTSINLLKSGRLPEGFEDIDWLLVDEVQDLTVVEFLVLVHLCKAVKERSYRLPKIILTGDEGQTIRPSGFQWGWMNGILYKQLGAPVEFELTSKLRTPRRISEVIDNSLLLYREIERGERPSKQRMEELDNENDGRVCYVALKNNDETIELLEALADDETLRVVVADSMVPNWIPPHLMSSVLSPSMVKGLEYQKICVLNPGKVLKEVASAKSSNWNSRVTGHRNRAIIDNLRVALSRAADTLVFVDVAPDDESRHLSKELLGVEAVDISPEDLIADVLAHDITPRERIESRIRDATVLLDNDPEAAWQRILQALQLHDRTDEDLGLLLYDRMLRISTRLLIEGYPKGVDINSITQYCNEAIVQLGKGHLKHELNCLTTWLNNRDSSPIALLNEIVLHESESEWLISALSSVSQSLLQGIAQAARRKGVAHMFNENVEKWLTIAGYTGNVPQRSHQLRIEAFNTLLKTDDKKAALEVLQFVPAKIVSDIAAESELERDWDRSLTLYGFLASDEDLERVSEEASNYYLVMGEEQIEGQNYKEAIESLSFSLEFNPGNAHPRILRAMAFDQIGRKKDALSDCEEYISIIQDEGARSSALVHKTRLLCELEADLSDVLECLDEAIILNPNNVEALMNRGDVYADIEKGDKAILDWRRVVALEPHLPESYIGLAEAYGGYDQHDKAEQVLTLGLSKTDNEPALLVERAHFRIASGKKKRAAEKDLNRASEAGILEPDLHEKIGVGFYTIDKFQKAVKQFESAMVLDPENCKYPELLARSYRKQYEANGGTAADLSKAIRALNRGIELAEKQDKAGVPRMYLLRSSLFETRNFRGDEGRSRRDRQRALSLDPSILTAGMPPLDSM